MITERNIAEKFSVIWKEHFPLLSSSFMKIFNETQIDIVNRKSIATKENVQYDLISEVAFNVSEMSLNEGITIKSILENVELLKDIVKQTAISINHDPEYVMNGIEEKEVDLIASNILEFIGTKKKKSCEFRPKFKGYGIISDLTADVSIDDTLFEFKAIKDNFRSSHIKQVFIYLALQQATGNPKWKYFGLYNPRKGTYCKLNIKNTVYELSGGKTPSEVFKDLLNNLTRDIQLDSRF